MSHRMCRQIGLEVSADTAGVAMGAGHLAPDSTELGLLAAGASSDGCPFLSSVHIHATLADVEGGVITVLGTFNLESIVWIVSDMLIIRENQISE